MTPPTIKIQGYMARGAPVAVLLIRRTGEWTHMVRWNTADDTFDRGQWVKGRVQVSSGDLSPDGSRIIYQLSKYLPEHTQQNVTVISRPPYFTALACWNGMGGGRFRSNNAASLYGPPDCTRLIGGSVPDNFTVSIESPDRADLSEQWRPHDQVIYDTDPFPADSYVQIAEDARALTEWIDSRTPKFEYKGAPEIRRKRGSHFDLEFEVAWNKKSFERRRAPLRREVVARTVCRGDIRYCLESASWADVDRSGRVVFARSGCVHAIEIGPSGQPVERLLCDFSDKRFEEVQAPNWALEW